MRLLWIGAAILHVLCLLSTIEAEPPSRYRKLYRAPPRQVGPPRPKEQRPNGGERRREEPREAPPREEESSGDEGGEGGGRRENGRPESGEPRRENGRSESSEPRSESGRGRGESGGGRKRSGREMSAEMSRESGDRESGSDEGPRKSKDKSELRSNEVSYPTYKYYKAYGYNSYPSKPSYKSYKYPSRTLQPPSIGKYSPYGQTFRVTSAKPPKTYEYLSKARESYYRPYSAYGEKPNMESDEKEGSEGGESDEKMNGKEGEGESEGEAGNNKDIVISIELAKSNPEDKEETAAYPAISITLPSKKDSEKSSEEDSDESSEESSKGDRNEKSNKILSSQLEQEYDALYRFRNYNPYGAYLYYDKPSPYGGYGEDRFISLGTEQVKSRTEKPDSEEDEEEKPKKKSKQGDAGEGIYPGQLPLNPDFIPGLYPGPGPYPPVRFDDVPYDEVVRRSGPLREFDVGNLRYQHSALYGYEQPSFF